MHVTPAIHRAPPAYTASEKGKQHHGRYFGCDRQPKAHRRRRQFLPGEKVAGCRQRRDKNRVDVAAAGEYFDHQRIPSVENALWPAAV